LTLLLVFPPFTDATQPAAALPSLIAAVDDLGIKVDIWDVNLDAWDYLLDPVRQAGWLARASRKLDHLDRLSYLNGSKTAAYLSLIDGYLRGTAAVGHIVRAVEVMRTEAFYSPVEYQRAMNAIRGALAVASATFHHARLEWGRFFPACSLHSSRAIVREATRSRSNPFASLAREVIAPRLVTLRPDMVGISVTYLDQVVPALSLAAVCKRVLPKTLVVLGGQIISMWGTDLVRNHELWRYVDVFVRGEGESAIRGLVEARIHGKPLNAVPNLILRRNGEPHLTSRHRENISRLRTPDYRGLPLSRYHSPEAVLTVSAARGCYWGRCAFCAVSPAFRDGFRARTGARVVADIATLRDRHAARLFTFGDDALPKTFVRDLAEGVLELPEDALWQAEARWEALLGPDRAIRLAMAGARNLIVGLESGSDDVLRSMRKGASLSQARQALAACARAGISVNLQCFLGFPGETRAQADKTLAFLREAAGPLTTISCGIFELQKGSAIWREPKAHGVQVVPPSAGDDLAIRFEYRPCPGVAYRRRLVLQAAAFAGARPPQMRCGIGAHALVYLARKGRATRERMRESLRPAEPLMLAGDAAFRWFAWDPDSLRADGKPRRKPTCLAYSLAHAEVMSVGALASTMLRQADGETRLIELLQLLEPAERRRVRRVVEALSKRGLLASSDSSHGAVRVTVTTRRAAR
jgi:anaerobic magnesium-protoporphyrin IX monomethyl ester cyclase